MNKVMLALAVITIMFAPFAVVGGLFGMNVPVPFSKYDNTNAFVGLTVFMTSISLILLLSFKMLRWI